jgi:hypothetical protein
MIRSLRAFVWLRWRLVLNSVRGGRRRDTLEQISRVLSMALPFIIVALAFGSVVAIAVVGFISGRALAAGAIRPDTALSVARGVLVALTVALVIFSVTSPIQGSLTQYTRLLLLPISRRTLHIVEVSASLVDPWIAFLAPGLLLFAVGLSVGGAAVAGAWAALAAVLFLGLLAAMAALIGFLVAWLLRDRRRSEWFTLVFVIGMSAVAFVPLMMAERSAQDRREARRNGQPRASRSVQAFDHSLPVWTRAVPSELYARAVRSGLEGRHAAAMIAVAGLAAEAALLFAASSVVHGRLIGSTTVSGRRRRGEIVPVSAIRLPGLSEAVSAVAVAQARTAMRSVRGRLLVFMSGPTLALLVFFFRRFDDVTVFRRLGEYGFVLAGVSMIMAILSAQSFTMNLFGSDKAGLTLQFLSPVSDAELARGKILGVGAVLAAAAALAVVSAVVVAPGGSVGLWIAAILGTAAVYLMISPVAVWMSALFPVASDLNRAGQGGNPHGLAAFAGIVALALAGGLTTGLFWTVTWGFSRPDLTLPAMAVWLAVVAAVAHRLVVLASRAISLRRENLAMVAQGK